MLHSRTFQVEPANGASFQSFVGIKVIFAWKAVAGAKHYVYEVNGAEYTTMGTSAAQTLNIGTHSWRVWAVAPSGLAGSSSSATFSIVTPIIGPML